MSEVHLKHDQITTTWVEVRVRARSWFSPASHTRRLKRVEPVPDIMTWLAVNVSGKWRFHKSTKSIVFTNEDDAFAFRMRW